jgi:hypothetical protein
MEAGMEQQKSYEQLIMEGLQDLPQDILAEIADFVYFVRRRATQPSLFAAERQAALNPNPTGGWLALAGMISPEDLQIMAEVVEADCEVIAPIVINMPGSPLH